MVEEIEVSGLTFRKEIPCELQIDEFTEVKIQLDRLGQGYHVREFPWQPAGKSKP